MNQLRRDMEERERANLSPFAFLSSQSAGRQQPEKPCPMRLPFQRDCDRLIRCKSFRRLTHKTQVFLTPGNDEHYRTRLTHTLEVAQIGRTIGVALRLNEQLIEAIALGHDLGHTPFGQAGEAVLSEVCPAGFQHHEQSLRVVDLLEKDGQGLNLSAEVRDGIARHGATYSPLLPSDLSSLPATLEGQVVRLADIIAYTNLDLEDALQTTLISPDSELDDILAILGHDSSQRISTMILDLIEHTLAQGNNQLCLGQEISQATEQLRAYLQHHVYQARLVHDDFNKAMKILRELYDYFMDESVSLPSGDVWGDNIDYQPPSPRFRMVCDFIAGMTDRYALDLYSNLFFPKPWSVV